MGVKMNIAVVDAGANLVAFIRMDDAWLGSLDIAIKKAKTARFFDMPTGAIGGLSQPGRPLFGIEHSNGGLISFPGGIPITGDGGLVMGAIGVSGSTVENDHAVAEAGGSIGIPGLYVTADPGAEDRAAQQGSLSIRFGLGWAKSHSFHTGQTPVLSYNRQLMQAILYDKVQIAKAVNVEVITLDQAPEGYAEFDSGVAKKFVIDPHRLIPA